MTLQALLAELGRELNAAGVKDAAQDLRWLAAHVLEIEHGRVIMHLHDLITPQQQRALRELADARAAGRPVSRLIGWREFWGRRFTITDKVLDPRPETETLIAAALGLPRPNKILDLGTGSGVIGVTLAAEWMQSEVTVTDLSDEALKVASDNAAAHNVRERMHFINSDWYQNLCDQFDLIVSNPPYIAVSEMPALSPEVRLHDPRLALTDEGDGLGAYRVIVAGSIGHLVSGGHLMVEIGWQQGKDIGAIFIQSGLVNVHILQDMDGRDRVICGEKPISEVNF